MRDDQPIYGGPRLRRLRREAGLTQAEMADRLDVSASYVALLERNQRPLTARLIMALVQEFDVDLSTLTAGDATELRARLGEIIKQPLLKDLDVEPAELGELMTNHPGVAAALLRLDDAHSQTQLALADSRAAAGVDTGSTDLDRVRTFLEARRNAFPVIDSRAEQLAKEVADSGGFDAYLNERYGIRVRFLPPDTMMGALRRYHPHNGELRLNDTLDHPGRRFQLALAVAYRALDEPIDVAVQEGQFETENATRIAKRALANFAAAAILMPYTAFYREAQASRYDLEALTRRFRSSFEQVAHRVTTLQRVGMEGIPFFFLRVDAAGNVSKRFDGAGFPFARHGGSCPLWSVHHTFRSPGEIFTEILELPDGKRYFSIARTVTAGGGSHTAQRIHRSIALCCSIEDANKLIYTDNNVLERMAPTPIGVSCKLCHRADCAARAEPPLGRTLAADDFGRSVAPFGFSAD